MEGELQLRALDHDAWEVEQVHLERPLQLSEQRLGRRCEDLSEAPPPALGPLGLLRPVT